MMAYQMCSGNTTKKLHSYLQGEVSASLFIFYPCLLFAAVLSVFVDEKPEFEYQQEGAVNSFCLCVKLKKSIIYFWHHLQKFYVLLFSEQFEESCYALRLVPVVMELRILTLQLAVLPQLA